MVSVVIWATVRGESSSFFEAKNKLFLKSRADRQSDKVTAITLSHMGTKD